MEGNFSSSSSSSGMKTHTKIYLITNTHHHLQNFSSSSSSSSSSSGSGMKTHTKIYLITNTHHHLHSFRPQLQKMFDESVESTVKVIVEKSFKRVALQFPDSLLEHSPRVVRALQDRLKDDVELFVLGDTQFGDRFVDEVAAQRAQADFLVHYGDAHVGPTESLPVQYVFGNQELKSLKCFPDTLKRKRVLLFTSWKYYNTCEQIGNMLRENGFEHVIVARPELNRDNMWVQRNRNEMDEVDTVVIENTPKQTELSSSSISKPIKTDQSSSSNTYNRDAFVQDENVDVFA